MADDNSTNWTFAGAELDTFGHFTLSLDAVGLDRRHFGLTDHYLADLLNGRAKRTDRVSIGAADTARLLAAVEQRAHELDGILRHTHPKRFKG